MLPTKYSFTNHIYLIYMYKQDLAWNNLPGLICYKTLRTSLIPPAMGWIILLLFFYKDGFGIKYPTKVDIPLNKEIQPN